MTTPEEIRTHHIAEAEHLTAEIDQWRVGDLALPDEMTADQQMRLAELHVSLAHLYG